MTIQYRMKNTGQLVTEAQYRALHPNVTFPAVLEPDDAEGIMETPPPTVDSAHIAVKTGVKQDFNLNWVYDWDIVPKPQEQIDAEYQATVPQKVTMRQARLALLGAGKLTALNAILAALPGADGEKARITWEYSQEVQRHQPLVLSLAPALGLTSLQIDALFIAANAL